MEKFDEEDERYEDTIKVTLNHIKDFQYTFYKWFTITSALLSVAMWILSLISTYNFAIFALIAVIYSCINLIISIRWKSKTISYINIIVFTILISIQCYFLKSAYSATLFSVILIFSALLNNRKIIIALFIYFIVLIFIFIWLGIYTIEQSIDEQTGIAFVNNVTALIPLLFFSFLIALIIQNILLRAINIQGQQNRELALKNSRLEKLNEEIKTLKSYHHICAMCKKIRDHDDTWVPLEDFMKNNRNTEFTHGYCHECAEKIVNDFN